MVYCLRHWDVWLWRIILSVKCVCWHMKKDFRQFFMSFGYSYCNPIVTFFSLPLFQFINSSFVWVTWWCYSERSKREFYGCITLSTAFVHLMTFGQEPEEYWYFSSVLLCTVILSSHHIIRDNGIRCLVYHEKNWSRIGAKNVQVYVCTWLMAQKGWGWSSSWKREWKERRWRGWNPAWNPFHLK